MLVVCPIYSSTQSSIPNPSLPAEFQKADLYGLPNHCSLVSGWVQLMGSTTGRLASTRYLFIYFPTQALPPCFTCALAVTALHSSFSVPAHSRLLQYHPPRCPRPHYTFLVPLGLGLGMTPAVASPCMLYHHHPNLYFLYL